MMSKYLAMSLLVLSFCHIKITQPPPSTTPTPDFSPTPQPPTQPVPPPTPTIPTATASPAPIEGAGFISPTAGRTFITPDNIHRVTALAIISPPRNRQGYYSIIGVDFSPDGRYIAIADSAGYIHMYDFIALRTGDDKPILFSFINADANIDVAFHPYRDQLVGCNWSGIFKIFDFFGDEMTSGYARMRDSVGVVQCNYANRGDILAVATRSDVILYQFERGELTPMRRGFAESEMYDVIFSHDDRILYTAGRFNFSAWDVETGEQLWSVESVKIWSINPLPTGDLIVTGADGRVQMYDAAGNLLRSYIGHTMDVIESAYSPDGRLFVTGSWDNQLLFWDTQDANKGVLHRLNHGELITDVGWSRDGALIASVGNNGMLILWGIP